jgi:septum formation inhibitor MinC
LINRQYSVKIFETTIEDDKKFKAFFDTNYILFKEHLILIKGDMSSDIEAYLKEKKFKYIQNIVLPEGRSRHAPARKSIKKNATGYEYTSLEDEVKALEVENGVNEQIAQAEIQKLKTAMKTLSTKMENNLTVLDSIIRSGQELKIEGDLLLLNRVNSGAMIHTTGNLIITQVVEGALRCDGNFMMITVSPKANIIFNGVIVDNDLLENKLNRIELKEREIFITPVIKKEINWVQ